MKFSIDPKIIAAYPTVEEHIVLVTGVNNGIAGKAILERTSEAQQRLRKKGMSVLSLPQYKRWVDIYTEILRGKQSDTDGTSDANSKSDTDGTSDANSKSDTDGTSDTVKDGIVPAHVALAQRIFEGSSIPNINPLVNLYNWYSIEYGLPIGGEDLSCIYGDIVLRYTKGGEKFVPISGRSVAVLEPGEIVWIDDHSVTCRMWGWRQCERTKITTRSKDVYFIFDSFSDIDGVDVKGVVERFSAEIEDLFGGSVQLAVLSSSVPSVEFDYKTKDTLGVDCSADLMKYTKKKSVKKEKLMKRKQHPISLDDASHMSARLTTFVDSLLNEILPEGVSSSISVSSDGRFGDFSSTLPLRLARLSGENHRTIGQECVRIMESNDRMSHVCSTIRSSDNGYLNLTMSREYLIDELFAALQQESAFGDSSAASGKTVLIESPSINPNAAAHIGHLLNLFIGRSLSRILKKAGFFVYTDNLINDRGIKICMAMWGVDHLADGETPKSTGMKPDLFVGKYYVMAKEEYRKNPDVKDEIDQMLRDWEDGDEQVMKLWTKVVDWAYDGHRQTLMRLGEELGHVWLESEHYKKGKDIIMSHVGKGVVEELPDSAVVARLEAYGLPDAVLLRNDGTSLYHTQDVHLTLQKIEKFNPWRAIWVVGNEQILHFQQLFALLDGLGILDIERVYHFAYGIVVDKQGRRIGKGTGSASADEMLDQMKEVAKRVMEKRTVDVVLDDSDAVAEAVGIGALRYSFLSRDPYRNVVYDPNSALSFTGKSGPYVMYAYTRGRSVLRKAGVEEKVDVGKVVEMGSVDEKGGTDEVCNYRVLDNLRSDASSVSIDESERKLLMMLLTYPEIILNAATHYAPHTLGEYLYDVASAFNNFYEKIPIAQAEGDQKTLRLSLTTLTTRVIRDGLSLLGIEVLEKM